MTSAWSDLQAFRVLIAPVKGRGRYDLDNSNDVRSYTEKQTAADESRQVQLRVDEKGTAVASVHPVRQSPTTAVEYVRTELSTR